MLRIHKSSDGYWLNISTNKGSSKVKLMVRGAVAEDIINRTVGAEFANQGCVDTPKLQLLIDDIDDIIAWVGMGGDITRAIKRISDVVQGYRTDAMVGG